MRRFLLWLTKFLRPPRVIADGPGENPYLSRWYLIGRPAMADGSEPFDEYGDIRLGVVHSRLPFGVYVHRFHRGDVDRELHNHPWRWSVSILLSGGYVEERKRKDNTIGVRTLKAPALNFISHDTFHRVDLTSDTWSLFIVGPKVSSWGFWCRHWGTFTPWREFLARKRFWTEMHKQGGVTPLRSSK